MSSTLLSPEFKSLAAKVYTFGFLALAIKFLTVEAVTYNGVKLPLESKPILIGALTITCICLTLAALLTLIRELILLRVVDTLEKSDHGQLTVAGLMPHKEGRTFLERNYVVVLSLSYTAFAIEAVVPILFGVATAIVCRQDMVGLFVAFTS